MKRIIMIRLALASAQIFDVGRFVKNSPPPYPEVAKTARYLVHNTDWTVVGTISSMDEIAGRPFTNTKSFCDGPLGNSTGTPYFYVVNLDASMQDILHGSTMSMTLSEALTDYCKTSSFDPQDPRCARVTLVGKMVNVTGSEKQFALDSLFSRHPEMKSWSTAHSFYPTKLSIDMIWLIDMFGGASIIPVDEYYKVHL